jgi:ribosomal protein S18 acetylase RimI-like enzyme
MPVRSDQLNCRLRMLGPADFPLIGQVDRSEVNSANYLAEPSEDGLALRLTRVAADPPVRIGPWNEADVKRRIDLWQPVVEAGGLLLGAFAGEKLCGFGVLGSVKKDRSAELHALFIDAGFRRGGVGGLLLRELERIAMERGGASIWCQSNRTASAVEFYLKHGYRPISLQSNHLVRHRPGDPVMGKPLQSTV